MTQPEEKVKVIKIKARQIFTNLLKKYIPNFQFKNPITRPLFQIQNTDNPDGHKKPILIVITARTQTSGRSYCLSSEVSPKTRACVWRGSAFKSAPCVTVIAR